MEAFKKNIVEDMKTADIAKLLVKTCIDLVTVENIHWEHTADSYLVFFQNYINNGLYFKDFMKHYSEDDIRKA